MGRDGDEFIVMINIGNHVSSSAGFLAMGEKTVELGGDTFAFFTRNPRGGKAKEIDGQDVNRLLELIDKNRFGKIVAHAPYTMNLCAAKEEIRIFAENMLSDDLRRMEYLPGNYYNFHPGSHVGQGPEAATGLIADALNRQLDRNQHTTVLLETMAGKGSEIGRTFEELERIIEKVELRDKLGVCFDTCHVWDAGYDIVNDLDGVLSEFDDVIGLDRLMAVHLNDSMNPCGSHKDRHQKLGQGEIGEKALRNVVTHPLLQGKPFILETPNDDEGYRHEIEMIREWMT